MMTIKELMENPCKCSPDGKHWEPALPEKGWIWWRIRLRDAWAVWQGKAVAVRQTNKADLFRARGEA
jgi:hypothetical protein